MDSIHRTPLQSWTLPACVRLGLMGTTQIGCAWGLLSSAHLPQLLVLVVVVAHLVHQVDVGVLDVALEGSVRRNPRRKQLAHHFACLQQGAQLQCRCH